MMAITNIDGEPSIALRMNTSSTSGGLVSFNNDTTNLLYVDEDGKIIRNGSNALEIEGGSSLSSVRIGAGAGKTFDFGFDSGIGHVIETDEFLRIVSPKVQLQGGNQSSDVMVDMLDDTPTVRLSFRSASGQAQMVSETAHVWVAADGSNLDLLLESTDRSVEVTAASNVTLDASNVVTIRADDDAYLHIWDDSASGSVNTFGIYGGAAANQGQTIALFTTNDSGARTEHMMEMFGSKASGAATIELHPRNAGDDAIIRAGDGEPDGTRGVLMARQDSDVTVAARRPAIAKLEGVHGHFVYLWLEDTASGTGATLRAALTDPGASTGTGVVVATF
jgi:hypothetical protein